MQRLDRVVAIASAVAAVGGLAAALALVAPGAALAKPRPEVVHKVRHHSARGGIAPSLIVIHTTEGPDRLGLEDLLGLGRWFDRPGRRLSSHVANDAEGNDARYVPDRRSALTQGRYNRSSLSIEQVGFARFSSLEWFARPQQLANTADWIAYWHRRHGIPIRPGVTRAGRVLRSGVVTHAQLSKTGAGTNHWDPVPGYPMETVLNVARALADA